MGYAGKKPAVSDHEMRERRRRSFGELYDPLVKALRGTAIEEYLRALVLLVRERGASIGAASYDRDQVSGSRSEVRLPRLDKREAWAGELLSKELRWLRDRADHINAWHAHPVDPSKKRVGKCRECGRGGPRGARFCAWDGEELGR